MHKSPNDKVFVAYCHIHVMKVTWDENLCIHSAKCVQGLPSVFKVQDGKFVIVQDGAPQEDIAKTVAQCPSKALQIQ